MNFKYHYWYFQNVLPVTFCEDIIKLGKTLQKESARIGSSNKINKKTLQKVRKSNVAWLNDQWIYKEIQPFIQQANTNAGWNFQWDFSESCQFTEYKKGQFYDWHCDSWDEAYNVPENINTHGKIRKLSVTISLSDPKDYKGGELQFDLRNKTNGKPNVITCKEILPKGSIVVFPSQVWHRVTPVTKGIRHSLVIWSLGKPFI
jgi:PKHD-type hydroxylase